MLCTFWVFQDRDCGKCGRDSKYNGLTGHGVRGWIIGRVRAEEGETVQSLATGNTHVGD